MADRPHARLALLAACMCITGCAGAIVRPSLTPAKPSTDAMLVLPGFGYSREAEQALRSLAGAMAGEGMDLYVPTYISRGGLAESRTRLQQFIREHHLDRYERVHVFAFLAGAWTLNPLVEAGQLPNLATIIYDRSPFQERAPRIAAEKLRFLTWVRYGSPVFDVARTPYVPIAPSGVNVALLVETKPTSFITHHEEAARAYGSFHFECGAFMQRYDDCIYVAMSHDELYTRFAELWPNLLTFIRTGSFTGASNRTPPAGDPLASGAPLRATR